MILMTLASFTIMLPADVQSHQFWKIQNLRNARRSVYCEPTQITDEHLQLWHHY